MVGQPFSPAIFVIANSIVFYSSLCEPNTAANFEGIMLAKP
jgi:hypothetical protein